MVGTGSPSKSEIQPGNDRGKGKKEKIRKILMRYVCDELIIIGHGVLVFIFRLTCSSFEHDGGIILSEAGKDSCLGPFLNRVRFETLIIIIHVHELWIH